MKIAFIPSTFLPDIGGAEIQAHNLANKLIEENNDVEVFLLNKISIKNANYKITKLNKYLISFVFLTKYYFYLNFSFLLKLYFKMIIKDKNFDIWHFQSVNYKTLIYIEVLKELNQKVVVTLQGADIQIDHEIKYGYRLDKKYDKFIKEIFQKVDSFHAISSSISNELTEIGVNKNKIIIIPNCSPIQKINNSPKKKSETLTILTIGRYAIKKKGFDLVEKVARELEKITNFKWIIIGRDTKKLLENEYIKNNSSKFEILNQIDNKNEIYFPNSELITYYKKSNVYANLARVEGSPIVLIDAIASNLPIVSFNTRGGDELVLNGKNGFIINNFNFTEYAKKILFLQKFKIDTKSSNISKHIESFDLTLNTKKIITCYKSLL
jgi:glycosyltransferase involved in cell wall biosynthesis